MMAGDDNWILFVELAEDFSSEKLVPLVVKIKKRQLEKLLPLSSISTMACGRQVLVRRTGVPY
jgi:hypothetical protein